jgi:hypothetical protein
MTLKNLKKELTNYEYNNPEKEARPHNSTYPKGGVLCSKDTFVVIETFVLLINICGESPALRVAAKRYSQFYDDTVNNDDTTI